MYYFGKIALPELLMHYGTMGKATLDWLQIEKFLETYDFIMNADVRLWCVVSAANANRSLDGIPLMENLANSARTAAEHI